MILAFLKDTTRPTVDEMKRGYVEVDATVFHGSGYLLADGQRVATIMGLDILRNDALADSHVDYYDDVGNLIATV